MENLESRDLEFLDLSQAFGAERTGQDIEDLFMPGRHYSPVANQTVADWLRSEIRRRLVTDGSM